jgi:hypothetical protein
MRQSSDYAAGCGALSKELARTRSTMLKQIGQTSPTSGLIVPFLHIPQ